MTALLEEKPNSVSLRPHELRWNLDQTDVTARKIIKGKRQMSPVHNYASGHTDAWGCGGIAPLTTLGTRCGNNTKTFLVFVTV
jgi:hypothetical protein